MLHTKSDNRRRMFISSPSQEDLRPTPRQAELLRNLSDWQEQSARYVKPMGWIPSQE